MHVTVASEVDLCDSLQGMSVALASMGCHGHFDKLAHLLCHGSGNNHSNHILAAFPGSFPSEPHASHRLHPCRHCLHLCSCRACAQLPKHAVPLSCVVVRLLHLSEEKTQFGFVEFERIASVGWKVNSSAGRSGGTRARTNTRFTPRVCLCWSSARWSTRALYIRAPTQSTSTTE